VKAKKPHLVTEELILPSAVGKGKVASVLNYFSTVPRRHMGSGGIAPPFLTSALDEGQLHALAYVPPGEEPPVLIG
jgi:hypothetical protein